MVTNSKRDCVTFLSEQSELVVKSLPAGKVIPKPEENPIPYNVMTMSVSADVLNTATEREIQLCPHFFQRNVAKMYELRVFVVASSMFAFQINFARQFINSSRLEKRDSESSVYSHRSRKGYLEKNKAFHETHGPLHSKLRSNSRSPKRMLVPGVQSGRSVGMAGPNRRWSDCLVLCPGTSYRVVGK